MFIFVYLFIFKPAKEPVFRFISVILRSLFPFSPLNFTLLHDHVSVLADNLGLASRFHVAEAQPWLLSCQGHFIPAAILYHVAPSQPALVSVGIPADPEMLFYPFLMFFSLCGLSATSKLP